MVFSGAVTVDALRLGNAFRPLSGCEQKPRSTAHVWVHRMSAPPGATESLRVAEALGWMRGDGDLDDLAAPIAIGSRDPQRRRIRRRAQPADEFFGQHRRADLLLHLSDLLAELLLDAHVDWHGRTAAEIAQRAECRMDVDLGERNLRHLPVFQPPQSFQLEPALAGFGIEQIT